MTSLPQPRLQPLPTDLLSVTAPSRDKAVSFGACAMPAGTRRGPDRHPCCRFLFSRKGVVQVGTETEALFLPPRFGLWVPANVSHTLHIVQAVELEFLHVADGVLGACTDVALSVVEVDDFATAFIHHICTDMPSEFAPDSPAARRMRVLLDLLQEMPEVDLRIPMPRSARMADMCAVICAQPSAPHGLDWWASRLGMSTRTFARHFAAETGVTFQAWRQNLRLISSVGLLRSGLSVTAVALDMGYANPSAFIHAFRKRFGISPARFAAGQRA